MSEHGTASNPSPQAVAGRLRRIAALEIRLATLQAELDRTLDSVRTRHARRLSGLRRRLAELTAELEAFCRRHRAEILPGDCKTLKTPFGEIGFRRTEPAVSIAAGMTAEDVCARLRRARLGRFVTTRYGLDRPAIRRALAAGRISPDRFAGLGLSLGRRADSFRYKVRREPLGVCTPKEGGAT